jgi:hypothetical protein
MLDRPAVLAYAHTHQVENSLYSALGLDVLSTEETFVTINGVLYAIEAGASGGAPVIPPGKIVQILWTTWNVITTAGTTSAYGVGYSHGYSNPGGVSPPTGDAYADAYGDTY